MLPTRPEFCESDLGKAVVAPAEAAISSRLALDEKKSTKMKHKKNNEK